MTKQRSILTSVPPEREEIERLFTHMRPKPIFMIAAVAANRVIGNGRRLPWHLPEDWDYFLQMTRGGIVIEGRYCHERSDQARRDCMSIVLTRNRSARFPGAETAHNLTEALERAQQVEHPGPIWICGGAGIYAEGIPIAERLYITKIRRSYAGDIFFPPWQHRFSRCISQRPGSLQPEEYTFCIYDFEPSTPG